MPIVNGNYYLNGDYGQSLEQGKIADAFPGLAEQTGSGDSWADRLVDHLTTPRSATEPPPTPAPPGMPPEAYDDMKINQLTVRQVANIVANEDRNVTRGSASPEDFYQSKLWKAHAIINGDRTYGDQRDKKAGTADKVDPQLENSDAYQQALKAARQAFQEQLAGKDPTGGRIWFNNRFTASTRPRVLDRAHPERSTVGVNRVFGPYEYKHKPIYTDINENAQGTPPRGKL